MDWRARTQVVNDATYAAWNAHDADGVAAVFADDARVRDASSQDWEIGRAPVRSRAESLFAAFPDFRLERQLLIIDGPRHSDRWILLGTHHGELLGLAPTGRAVRVEGATFTTLGEHGLVIEDVHHVDYATLFRQLGAS